MTVYVDELRVWGVWKYGESCHMTADTDEELHEFAARIGMKRQWFQNRTGYPHYDLTIGRRAKAVRLGAVEVWARERLKELRCQQAETTSGGSQAERTAQEKKA